MDNLVTIGILTYQRTDLLVETLKDIIKSKYKINLVVVNNNENIDVFNEIEFIKQNKKINLIYIWDKMNYGVAIGRNKIIENLHTDYMIIFDDDVVIPDINNIIENCVYTFSSNKHIGGIAFHIKDNNSKKANRFEIPHKNKNINLSNDFFTYIFIGAGHAVSKKIIDKIGGYPTDFGLYGMEEIDLAFKILGAGHSIKFLTNNVIYHKRSPSGRHNNSYIYYLSYINRCKIAIRYFKIPYVVSCIVVRGLFMLFKTRNYKYIKQTFIDLKQEFPNRNQNSLFDENFYAYIKEVKGFLWW
ncbi:MULTISPECIES: glycosyltransferase family 2 protein [unclassified Campylobacter]|uniref:glycosyltransferase family 2 protein n=1 Tax=unclassified Campylobacter TaxID=2593542 RepID=UPI0022E9976E|nr:MULTISPECIES: glycosyltransferase [unclassified Campylobacter]MDA3043935.1 glycosyltransferase [Campylobacter sp. JMF_09 ED2]MDA3045472.1 glycosyltransferase [Campylobacter sp. JMF_07 ED4]MDA3064108.1 glycosyltransferase [Campylobacter sp. JMF_11 EL3]MDA3072020.1 glycosyltransferase [Campylobacter sp. VBCF_03 NA9]MDA3075715.1 glycosyltransferase [Campylobacter sp. JMF_05 ED3]